MIEYDASKLINFFHKISDNDRKRFRRPSVAVSKSQIAENNIAQEKSSDIEASATVNRQKLYHRVPKPFKTKSSSFANGSGDLEISASVNRPTILHRHYPRPESGDVEAQESTQKVTRLNFRRKPTEISVQETDQETSPSINRNNIQRRILKPNQGNSLLENENAAEETPSTSRMKIRRRISKPDHVNSASEDSKTDDHDSSAASRFKVRQKFTGLGATTAIQKSGDDSKDSDGYKVGYVF